MNRNTGLIATIAAVVLCGCPGLFLCIMGIGTVMGAGTYTLNDQVGNLPPTYGYVFLCLSLIFILVPVLVGFFTLRKKPEPVSHEPLPPAS